MESDIDSSENEQNTDDEFGNIVEFNDEKEFDQFDDDDDDDEADGDAVTDQLLKIWKGVKPPNKEENLVGKRNAVVYSVKRSKILFTTKHDQSVLVNADGEIDKLLMTCLKPKVGLGTILENKPKRLLLDQGMFDPWDIIFGSMEAVPL